MIRTQLSHSTKLWSLRTSLFVLILRNLILLIPRKVSLVLSQSILGYKNMAYLTARTNLLESSKFLLKIIKFLLWLLQENDFLFQAKICLGRFLVSKKWLI